MSTQKCTAPIVWQDERRKILVPGKEEETVRFATEHFIETAKEAITNKGVFTAALSGGSTPKKIFEQLSSDPYAKQVDWEKVHLFWSDERSVAPSHPDSNYLMAMEAGLKTLPIPSKNIHRMKAENDITSAAQEYEEEVRKYVPKAHFDLLMLGMGEDGHTASLFPGTKGLSETERLVIANEVPQKNTWRMTFTFPCINAAQNICIYVIGAGKAEMIETLFKMTDRESFPIESVGTNSTPALWIIDEGAAAKL
ncbi:MAG: 6-phosphogluconolactonase [Waddliaceae bacterium]|nr:6-phosphogluconolactonase [Waddliaceae bacterium]